jgi:NHL repeat
MSARIYGVTFSVMGVLLLVTRIHSQTYNWITIAGNAGWGSTDGTNSDGRFWAPVGIATDGKGDLFVTDYRSDTIRKLTPAGTNWVVSTLAGLPGSSGSADGTNSTARFYSPVGVTVDMTGNVFVADCYNYTVRELTQVGTNWVVKTIAGKARSYGSVDGTNNSAGFGFVYGIVADNNNNIYVADGGNKSIRKLTPMGTNWVVTTIAALGAYPEGLAIDLQGNLYETDRSHTVRQILPTGTNWQVKVLAGSAGSSGSADGTNSTARFYYPGGLAVDGNGHLLVADSNNHTIRCLTQDGTNWVVTTIAGIGGKFGDVDGSNGAARFYYPAYIALSTNGVFYVTDDDNYCIRSLMPVGTNWVVGTIAGSGGPGNSDGTNHLARFNSPEGMALDINGDAYVADQLNNTVRQLARSGTNWVISTIAGMTGIAGSADGTNSEASFSAPGALASDGSGNLFLSDTGNDTIRELTPQGTNWVVSTIAGQAGIQGSADGTNSDALFARPYGIATDTAGDLFVADAGNDTIRKLSPLGTNWVVTTIAGLTGFGGYLDGTNSNARFSDPLGLAVDSAGSIFVADYFNNCIRKVVPVGTNWLVTTVAGSHLSAGGVDGTNGAALFWNPTGIAVTRADVLFVADAGNDSIRKITPTGTNWVVTTIGGMDTIVGVQPFVGNSDGTNSLARFNRPAGIAVDANGNVFVADTSNNTIRQGLPLLPTILALSSANGTLTLIWSAVPGQTYQVQYNTNLLQANWRNLGFQIIATNVSASASDYVGDPQRFYRVEQVQ